MVLPARECAGNHEAVVVQPHDSWTVSTVRWASRHWRLITAAQALEYPIGKPQIRDGMEIAAVLPAARDDGAGPG